MNDKAPANLDIPADTQLVDIFPYSRAVKRGPWIEISGSGAYDGDTAVHPGNLYEQTKFIYEKFSGILGQMGSSLQDIVKITIYLKDIANWKDVARAHKQYFIVKFPAVTLVEVSALIDPEMEIEIEASAYIQK